MTSVDAAPAGDLDYAAEFASAAATGGYPPVSLLFGAGAAGSAALVDRASDMLASPDDLTTAGEVTLHNTAVGAGESFEAHQTVMSNRLQDARTMANIEARKAVADAYEAGESATTAATAAADAVREYYATVQRNHLEAVTATLIQLQYIFEAAEADDAVVDGFLTAGTVSNWSGGTATPGADYGSSMTTGEVTLVDGSTLSVTTPQLVVRDDTGSQVLSKPIMDDGVIGTYDSAAGTNGAFVVADGSGGTVTTDLEATLVNVPVTDGPDLEGAQPVDLTRAAETLTNVSNEVDAVISNFSDSFVSSIYSELDAGTITPTDIRGIEGQASYLSGSDVTESSAYRYSLWSQLDTGQVDVSQTASMTVTYSGFSGIKPHTSTDSYGRGVMPSGYQSNTTATGMLFADDAALSDGDTVLVDPLVAWASRDDDYPSEIAGPSMSGSIPISGTISGVGSTGSTLVVGTDSGDIVRYDLDKGEKIWRKSHDFGGYPGSIVVDGSSIYICDKKSGQKMVLCLSMSDGSKKWQRNDIGYMYDASLTEGMLFVTAVANGTHYIEQLDTDTGETIWSVSQSGGCEKMAAGDGVIAIFDDSTSELRGLSADDGSELWRVDALSDKDDMICISDGTVIFAETSLSTPAISAVNVDGSNKRTIAETPDTADPVFYDVLSDSSAIFVDAYSSVYLFDRVSGDFETIYQHDKSGEVVSL